MVGSAHPTRPRVPYSYALSYSHGLIKDHLDENTGQTRPDYKVGVGIGIGIGIGIEGEKMGFGHEKRYVYRTSIAYVGWAYRFRA
jgi:hypothetical protein